MRKKYPFVKQEDLKDCGVASLLMIIRYYKGDVLLEKLREMTKTTKIGTSAYYLVEAAKEIGFRTDAIRLKMNEFEENKIYLPCIAYVTIDKIYNHFLVIYKIDYKNKRILVECKICGYEWEPIVSSLLRGSSHKNSKKMHNIK